MPITSGGKALFSDIATNVSAVRNFSYIGLPSVNDNEKVYNDVSPLNWIRFTPGAAQNAVPQVLHSNVFANIVYQNSPLSPNYSASSFVFQGPSYQDHKYISFVNWRGNYKVVGKVQINTVNSPFKWVYLFPQNSPGLCIGAQYTDSSGSFTFSNLSNDKYVVYAMDPNFSYNGKLYENVQSVSQ